jgi:hypothetical protein
MNVVNSCFQWNRDMALSRPNRRLTACTNPGEHKSVGIMKLCALNKRKGFIGTRQCPNKSALRQLCLRLGVAIRS